MERPRPVPPCSRRPVWKGSKMRSRSASANAGAVVGDRERRCPSSARRRAIRTSAGAGLAAVLDQDLEHRLEQLRREPRRRAGPAAVEPRPRSSAPRSASATARQPVGRASVAARSAATRHVGAGEVEQALEQQRQPVGVGGGVGEEAAALLLAHRRLMVLEQFERAPDPGDRGLELVADRGGEIAQIARAALDPLGHRREILVEGADLDRGGGRRLGHGDGAARDVLGRLAQRLDRPGDAAREQAGEDEQGERRSGRRRARSCRGPGRCRGTGRAGCATA